MMLVCNAYGGDGDGADFVTVPVTPEFLETLQARRRLAQRLAGTPAAEGLDSLLFHEGSPQWLSWSEDLEELLLAAGDWGWTLAGDDRIAIADTGDDPDLPHPVRTDCEFLQVWPERFQFVCCLRNSDSRLQSAMLYFDDFLTAAARRAPAAEWRPAA